MIGNALAQRGIGLVYGGANVGIMGQLADAALAGGAEVIGVIPGSMSGRVAHAHLSKLHVVSSMHERKALMIDLADAFVALPGGIGTMEEFLEVVTWAQLDLHRKPCGLLNVCRYYDHMLAFIDHAVASGLVKQQHRELVLVDESPEALLSKLQNHRATAVDKWSD
jgi:uncharacterized protein (TIGR00730 family)